MTLREVAEPTQGDPFRGLIEAAGAAESQMQQLWVAIDALIGIDQADGSVSDATIGIIALALDTLLADPEVQAHQIETLRSKVVKYRAEDNPRAAAYFERELADWNGSAD